MLPLLCYLLLASFSPARTQDLTFDFSKILEADSFPNGSIPISIDIDGLTSPDDILNKARNISSRIVDIISTLETLRATINSSSLTEETKLKDISSLVTEFNFASRISKLNNTLASLKQNISETTASLNSYRSITQCMGNQECVTAGPTTTLAPTMCWPANGTVQPVDGTFSLSSNNYPTPVPLYNCQYTVQAGFAYHLNIDVNLEITRSANLSFNNLNTGDPIAVFNSSTTAHVKTNASAISVVSAVDDRDGRGKYSFIAFNVTFKTADICEDVNCGNGTCVANPDNTYSCKCNKCWETDPKTGKCAAYTNKCVGSALLRCTKNGGNCVIDPAAALCATKCQCPGLSGLVSKC